jgi:hypothetical protein
MTSFLPLIVFVGFVLLLGWLLRPRRCPDQQDEAPPPGRAGEWAKAFLFLFVLWLVVEIIAITTLGSNAQNTFRTVPTPSPGK